MTYYLKESDWYHGPNVPEGMNLDMINQSDRLTELLLPAIDQIEPGKIVIDLGCGTGLLGIHALKKGAKFVYFVERDEQMFHILLNVLPKKIDPSTFKLINKDICELVIEDFDQGVPKVVVSEFYGPRLFDEGYVNYTKHIRSMFPECFFIPETFVGEFYLGDVDFKQPIWPIDDELIDHYKFMYRSKGFSKCIDSPHNLNEVGKIQFDANNQEFINSFEFTYESTEDKILYGRMIIKHNTLIQYYTAIGWYMDKEDSAKKFQIHVDPYNFFNTRLNKL